MTVLQYIQYPSIHVKAVQCPWTSNRGQLSQVSLFLFFPPSPSLSLFGCLIQRPALALQPWQITAVAFVGRANYTTCHVGRVAGSRAHGRFSGFNYISLAGR